MSDSVNSGRPTIDVLVITGLLVSIFFLMYYLTSWWLFAIPGGFTVIFALSLVISNGRSFGETFHSELTVPGWLIVSVPAISMIIAGSLNLLSTRSMLSVILVTVAGIQFVAGLCGGHIYEQIFGWHRLSWWLLGWGAVGTGVGAIAMVLANGSLFKFVLFFSFVLFALFLLFIIPVATVQKWQNSGPMSLEAPYPTVSVIIPAYNEEKCIGQCIESVLDATYPTDLVEVLVIDDGSTDNTYAKAAQYRDRGVEVYHKENGGKYSALNYGLFCSSGEIVVCVDADGRLKSTALLTLVSEFQDNPNLGSVAGNVKVGNRNRHLTRLQALEYLVGINTYRRAFSWFDAVPIVPGCLSGFRREALEEVHGYDPDTITEDFDITIKILKEGWKVKQSDAIVWTEAPFTLRDLYEQRRRWFTGGVETLLKHRGVFFDDSSGNLHKLSFPVSVFLLILAPAIFLPIYAAIFLAFINNINTMAFMMIVSGFSIVVIYSLLVVRMENDSLWLVLYAPLYMIGYKQFLEAVLLFSLVGLLIRNNRTWGSIRRRGQLDAATPDGK